MDDRLELKIIIGFGETESGIPITMFYYPDKLGDWGEDFDIDSILLDKLIRVGYATYFTFEDICHIIDRKSTTAKRFIKKVEEKGVLKEQPIKEKGKLKKMLYYIKEDVYGIEQTKRLYGTDEFYKRAKFAAETDARNFIEGYPKPENDKYYYNFLEEDI